MKGILLLMNEENERERRKEEPEMIRKRVDQIRRDEVRKAFKRKYGSAFGKWLWYF